MWCSGVNALADFLLNPSVELPIDDLPRHWRRSTLQVTCQVPSGFEGGAWFVAAVRGAWGHRLIDFDHGRTDGELIRALFRPGPDFGPGRTLPAPYTFGVDECGNKLFIELTLNGVADCWRKMAFDALISAFHVGMSIRPERRGPRVPLEILEAAWVRTESISVPQPTGSSRLLFKTPVRLGPRRSLSRHWPDLIVALADRVSRLARWQGIMIEPQLGRWRDLAEKLEFRDEGMVFEGWARRSGAQGGRCVPMMGMRGSLDIIHTPPDVLVLLAIGQHIFVGGHTALGLGRYELLC
jgi:hypothetical protein